MSHVLSQIYTVEMTLTSKHMGSRHAAPRALYNVVL